jgi:hypothetical protein
VIFRSLFGSGAGGESVAELPVVRNITIGRTVRLDTLAWRRLEGLNFDLGRDTLDITAQGRIRLDDGSFVHRFYTNDDVMLQAVSAMADGSDADDFTIFHPWSSTYPSDELDTGAFARRLFKASWQEEGLPASTASGMPATRATRSRSACGKTCMRSAPVRRFAASTSAACCTAAPWRRMGPSSCWRSR